MNKPFSVKERLKSFTYAFQGFKVMIESDHNARIHLIAALLAIIVGILLNISALEWIIIVFSIFLVLAAETFNTAIEHLCNFVSPGYHDMIKKIKDLSSLAVLFIAIAALLAGVIIFLPKIFHVIF